MPEIEEESESEQEREANKQPDTDVIPELGGDEVEDKQKHDRKGSKMFFSINIIMTLQATLLVKHSPTRKISSLFSFKIFLVTVPSGLESLVKHGLKSFCLTFSLLLSIRR